MNRPLTILSGDKSLDLSMPIASITETEKGKYVL